MLEARLGDGFPTERGTAEAPGSAGCLLTLLPVLLPRKTASHDFHKVQDIETHRSSSVLGLLQEMYLLLGPSSSTTQSYFQVVSPPGWAELHSPRSEPDPGGGYTTRPADCCYTYISRVFQGWGPADFRLRATWRLRDSGRTRAGIMGPAAAPEALGLRPPRPGCWPEGHRWLRRR